jgi:peroxiredoxin Q/BCP
MKKELKIGNKAPKFCLPDADENSVCLKNFKGKWIILYFYPKDNTSGCTKEAIGFTEKKEEFENLGAVILGVSPDSSKSHRNFREKKELTITLLSDPEHKVLEAYGAWQLKKMYGREYMGVVRSTYLIDPEGKNAYIWPKVKVKGHVEDVLEKLKELREKT